MDGFGQRATRHPWLACVVVGALTLCAGFGVVDPRSGSIRLRMDASTESLLPDDDERADFYAAARQRFGVDDGMLLVLVAPDLFSRERLAQLVDLTRRVRALPGVHDVLSLASAVGVSGDPEGIDVGSPLSPLPAEPERLREQVLAHPLWAGTLVSRDGEAAALLVTFDQDERELLESALPRRVAELAREAAPGAEVLATGTAYVRLALTEAVLRDLQRLVPAVVGVLLLVLVVITRSLRGVIVPLATIGVGVTWTLGTLGWLGIPLTLVTAVLPPLLLTVGFAYALHVVMAEPGSHGDAILDQVGLAVVFAGLTTAIGFLALVLSPIASIREFGVLAALGIGYTVVASLTLAPALCALLPAPRQHASRTWIERVSVRLADFDVRQRRAVIGVSGLLFVAGCAALAHVQTGMDPIDSFASEAPERVALERIKQRFGGVSPLSVVLELPTRGAFAEPERLRQVDEFARWLRADPDVAHVTSVAELLRLLNGAVRGDAGVGLPDSTRMARQLLLLAAGPEQRSLIDGRQQSVRLLVRARAEDSATLLPLIRRIEARIAELPVEGGVTGTFVLLSRAGDALARGQLRSLLAAVGVIYVVLALMFRSARIGAVAFLPNALAIGVFFALLAATGIPLNPTTGLIACTALGIAVDGTIHYLVHYRAEARRTGSEAGADRAALRAVMRPVTCTALGLCAGFGSMQIAELQDHVRFGWLAAATLGTAWLSLVVLAPALTHGQRVLGAWDRLVRAFGAEPARAVPLLRGLSVRDARRLLRDAQLRELPADAHLISAGEDWRALWVVLAGELVATRDGDPVAPLAKLGRGEAVGVGAPPASEPCHVVALSDAQLLRIPGASLATLRRKHPELARRIERNLVAASARS